jgi:NTP pyrophosphatase (non-canonical NTP hydrolase)
MSGAEEGDMGTERSLTDLQSEVMRFCEARDWDQFHGPKDLAIGIVTEASELLELFRFKSDGEALAAVQPTPSRQPVEDELADVLFFVLRFAQRFSISLEQALLAKLEKNVRRYPVEMARGSNQKTEEV